LSLYGSATGAVLIAASIVRGRIVGGCDVRLGLGLVPIARLPIIVFLGISVAAYAALRDYALLKLRPDIFYQSYSANSWIVLFYILVVVIVAPIAEEFFCRGWLWNGLRQRWDALAVALFTTAFWLALHLLDVTSVASLALIAALLPLGLLIALARQIGSSVYASISLHAIYNFIVGLPMLLMALGLLEHGGSVQQSAPLQQNAPIKQDRLIQQSAPAQQTVAQKPIPTIPVQTPQTLNNNSPTSNREPPTVINREVFTGSESQIAAMNFVNADCSSGAVPEVRIGTAPANGNARLQQITIAIGRPASDPLARCNGKPVEAMGVFYKANNDFKGTDTMVLDVDFRRGKVIRVIYNISVQ